MQGRSLAGIRNCTIAWLLTPLDQDGPTLLRMSRRFRARAGVVCSSAVIRLPTYPSMGTAMVGRLEVAFSLLTDNPRHDRQVRPVPSPKARRPLRLRSVAGVADHHTNDVSRNSHCPAATTRSSLFSGTNCFPGKISDVHMRADVTARCGSRTAFFCSFSCSGIVAVSMQAFRLAPLSDAYSSSQIIQANCCPAEIDSSRQARRSVSRALPHVPLPCRAIKQLKSSPVISHICCATSISHKFLHTRRIVKLWTD